MLSKHAKPELGKTGAGDDDSRDSSQASPEHPHFIKTMSATLSPDNKCDDGMEKITSNMSALKFVPPSIRFGRGGKRGGLSRS